MTSTNRWLKITLNYVKGFYRYFKCTFMLQSYGNICHRNISTVIYRDLEYLFDLLPVSIHTKYIQCIGHTMWEYVITWSHWRTMVNKPRDSVCCFELTLLWDYYNHALRQVDNLFNKVILCVQRHATMFVQVRFISVFFIYIGS